MQGKTKFEQINDIHSQSTEKEAAVGNVTNRKN